VFGPSAYGKLANASGSPRHSAENASQPNMPFHHVEDFMV